MLMTFINKRKEEHIIMSCTQNPGTHQSDKQSFLSIQNSTVGEICLWTSRFRWPAQTHIWAISRVSSVPFTQSQSLSLRSTLILPFSLIISTMLNVKIFRITITRSFYTRTNLLKVFKIHEDMLYLRDITRRWKVL